MNSREYNKEQLQTNGFVVINQVFAPEATELIAGAIAAADKSGPGFRRSNDLFAIRQFLQEVPAACKLIFTDELNALITQLFGDGYFVVKSIYFDKPPQSNWFVAWHQDLTIAVDKKVEVEGFDLWTVKQQQFAVQPPTRLLADNFTIRIHLDDTDEANGALKVVPGSHLKGICRPETIDWTVESESICRVNKGGVMIMRPLLLHSSGRTVNDARRRVIHIEFSRQVLPGGMEWAEQWRNIRN